MQQINEDPDEFEGLTPKERLQCAKIRHYIDRAEECIRMSRFLAARRLTDKVLDLDPVNVECKDLQAAIEERLLRLSSRSNGVQADLSGDHKDVGRRRRTELVLIVDQDERVLTSLSDALQRYGFETLGAASFEEAMETLAVMPPDVVISEVNFEKGAQGFDFYHWVKTHVEGRDIPFVYLASRIDRETLIAGKRFGVDDFLQKPADAEVILASISNCLARRRTVQQPA